MEKGDKVILTEPVVSVGKFGAEYLVKNTTGIFISKTGELAEIEILSEKYTVPIHCIESAVQSAA